MTRIRRAAYVLMLAATAACAVSCAGIQPDVAGQSERHDMNVVHGVRYASDGPLDLTGKHLLDIYRPKDAKGAPVLIFVHGGAWRFGDKILHGNVGRTFAERGLVTVAIDYGLAPFGKHPAQVRDVARAFAWVKKNIAQYGGDPGDIFISGHSAGGHLAALLALNDKYLKEQGCSKDDIRGFIGLSGVYRIDPMNPVFAGVFDNNEETIRDASPVRNVGDKQPPALLVYGDADIPGLGDLAIELTNALQSRRSPVKLVRVPNRTHDMIVLMIGTQDDPVTNEMMEFIRAHSSHGR